MRGNITIAGLVLFAVGCAGKTSDPPSASETGSDTGTTAGDAIVATDTTPIPTDTTPIVVDAAGVCFGDDGSVPSTPFKPCSTDADCTFASHGTDCCGNTLLVGIAKSQEAAFGACEKGWKFATPMCGCPSGPPKTEDGKSIDFGGKPSVKCTDFTSGGGICKTFAP